MSITAGLPWRHPAVLLGIGMLVACLAAIGYEEHLQTIGVLPVQPAHRLVLAILGSIFWAWCTVKMIGEPAAFFDISSSLVNAERDRRRLINLARLGYVLQVLTISGALAFVMRWA